MTPRDELTPETLRCAWVPLREYCEETLRDHASAWAADRKELESCKESWHKMSVAYNATCERIEALERVDKDTRLPDGWVDKGKEWAAGWNAALRAVAIKRAALRGE